MVIKKNQMSNPMGGGSKALIGEHSRKGETGSGRGREGVDIPWKTFNKKKEVDMGKDCLNISP